MSKCVSGSPSERADWAGSLRQFAIVWGLPVAAILVAAPFAPPAKTLVWTGALIWMGAACLANARRCGRTHCRFTGPYFLALAGLTLAHGGGLLPLGPHGWAAIGLGGAVGAALLWWGSERLMGKYFGSPKR